MRTRPEGNPDTLRIHKPRPDRPRPEKPRIDWMDALRGIAVLLVVFDHTLFFVHQELGRSDILLLDPISDVLNPVRMPAMAFLSGLLLAPSLAKGTSPYLWGKVSRILWPFLVWSFIYISAWVAATPISGTPHSLGELMTILWDPPAHLWYLRDLFVFYLLALVLHNLPRGLALAPAVAALSLLLCALTQEPGANGTAERFFFLFAFFLLGGWLSTNPGRLERLLRSPGFTLPMLALAALLIPAALIYGNIRYDWYSAPLTLAGITVLALAAQGVCRTGAGPAARFIGRESLTVYVFHWLVVAATAIVTARLAPGIMAGLMAAAVFAAGLGASLAMIHLTRRFPVLDALFSFPRQPPGKGEDRAGPLRSPLLYRGSRSVTESSSAYMSSSDRPK